MNSTTFTTKELASKSWHQIIALKKPTIIAILDELGFDYDCSENYFKLCSKVYQHFKQQQHQESAVVVDYQEISFRELQRKALGKDNEPVQQEVPTRSAPRQLKVLKVWDNGSRYYGMPVVRCLVQDPATLETFWTGSNAAANIQPGDIVIEAVGVIGTILDWVVPLNRAAKA